MDRVVQFKKNGRNRIKAESPVFLGEGVESIRLTGLNNCAQN